MMIDKYYTISFKFEVIKPSHFVKLAYCEVCSAHLCTERATPAAHPPASCAYAPYSPLPPHVLLNNAGIAYYSTKTTQK